jgi:hypothetical protein
MSWFLPRTCLEPEDSCKGEIKVLQGAVHSSKCVRLLALGFVGSLPERNKFFCPASLVGRERQKLKNSSLVSLGHWKGTISPLREREGVLFFVLHNR